MKKIKKAAQNYKFDLNDIRAGFTVLNLVLVILFGWAGCLLGFCVAFIGIIRDMTACTNSAEKQTNTATNQEVVTTLPAEEPVNMGGLTDEEIKSIVYEHAQVKPEDINYIVIEKEFYGEKEIEVNFWIGKTEYSYTLDLGGNILEFEVERND